jgi:tetratricopeptide (TPR) repeat protein
MIKLIFYEYVIENGLGIWNSWKDRRKLGRKNKDSKRFVKEGNKLGELGKYDEAFKCFDKATKLDPEDADAWGCKGEVESRLGKHDEAFECFDKAIKLDPNTWGWKGCLILSGLKSRANGLMALKCCDKAIKLAPKPEIDAWVFKGIELGNLGKYDEAHECFDKANKIDPKNDSLHLQDNSKLATLIEQYGRWDDIHLGTIFLLSKSDKALECFDKATKLNPKDDEAWIKKGTALLTLDKPDKALECFDKATKLDPKNDQAWTMMGTASSLYGNKLKKGEKQEKLMWQSVKCYQKAHELNPENPDLIKDAEDEYNRNA